MSEYVTASDEKLDKLILELCNKRTLLTRRVRQLRASVDSETLRQEKEHLETELKNMEKKLGESEYEYEVLKSVADEVEEELNDEEQRIFSMLDKEDDKNSELKIYLDEYMKKRPLLETDIEVLTETSNIKKQILDMIMRAIAAKTGNSEIEFTAFIKRLDQKILNYHRKVTHIENEVVKMTRDIEDLEKVQQVENQSINSLTDKLVKLNQKIQDLETFGVVDEKMMKVLKDDSEITDMLRYDDLKKTVRQNVRTLMNELETLVNHDITKMNAAVLEINEYVNYLEEEIKKSKRTLNEHSGEEN